MYRIARVFPQDGIDGEPFIIDMRNKNMTRNWAGEAKVDWRMWEPERPATNEQALCYSERGGGDFDITYNCIILRW
jgi:hypothetical protein